MGLKPRGLCWHWARDIEDRLKAEAFETLEMHRAIADPDNMFRLEHSTAIISARGDSFDEGHRARSVAQGRAADMGARAEDDMYDWEARTAVRRASWSASTARS